MAGIPQSAERTILWRNTLTWTVALWSITVARSSVTTTGLSNGTSTHSVYTPILIQFNSAGPVISQGYLPDDDVI